MAVVDVYGQFDVHISELVPDTNFEAGSDFAVQCGFLQDKFEVRALLRADLSAYVPNGSTNLTAVLWLNLLTNSDHASDAYRGYHCLRAWVEGDALTGATWNDYNAGAWGTAGCKLLNTDYETAGEWGPWNPAGTGWKSVDCSAMVQAAWADDKSFDCMMLNGAVIAEDEVATITFNSRGHANEWFIRVTYDPPAGVPGGLVRAAQVI